MLLPRSSLLVPSEFVVPACGQSRFSTLHVKPAFTWEGSLCSGPASGR